MSTNLIALELFDRHNSNKKNSSGKFNSETPELNTRWTDNMHYSDNDVEYFGYHIVDYVESGPIESIPIGKWQGMLWGKNNCQ